MSIKACEHHGHCQQAHHAHEQDFNTTLSTVANIALVAFSLYMAPQYFLASMLFGFTWALIDTKVTYNHWSIKLIGCPVSFMSNIARGVNIPTPIMIAADAALNYAHIDHHPEVFGAMAGVAAGLWLGVMLRA